MTVRDYLLHPNGILHTIISNVARKHGITLSDIMSRRKSSRLVKARQEAYWRCATETNFSYPTIARHFGSRDHSTVLYGVRRYEELYPDEVAKGILEWSIRQAQELGEKAA